jgi:hypothetical protein
MVANRQGGRHQGGMIITAGISLLRLSGSGLLATTPLGFSLGQPAPGRRSPPSGKLRIGMIARALGGVGAHNASYCFALGRTVVESPTVRPGKPAASK